MEFENVFKVKLVSSVNLRRRVVFDVTPDIAENQNVNYKNIEPIHAPSSFWVYQNTPARAYNLSNIKLISRTIEEATLNLQRVNCLRAWTKPFFGEGTATGGERGLVKSQDKARVGSEQDTGQLTLTCFLPGTTAETDRQVFKKFLGSPPEVILLSAYANKTPGETPSNISRVPVIMTQLSLPYPSDVDYIPTEDGTPFPAIMSIDMQLSEAHSPRELRQFDLHRYRRGILTSF
ncbi:hypothetical protein LCGC14_1801870 [marine sediment metagenome]|uniref:Uncharacterized protein n=1 Tax=marine sediment metagenome TaxID=412755 RepID=A0A0F9JP18_9ZZZZ